MTSEQLDHESQTATRPSAAAAPESRELQRTRSERDAALEELAFLREQLRSTEAFYAHRFELEYARLYAEHQGFLEELARLSSDFQRRVRRDDPTREDERTAVADQELPPRAR